MKKKILVFGLLLSLVVFGTGRVILAEDEVQSSNQQSNEVNVNNNGENQDLSVSEGDSTTEELEEVPLDVTGSEIKLSPIYKGRVKPSLVITPAGIAKLTRALVTEIDYNNKSGKVKVWGMEFRIDASNAYVIKRPIYRRILGKKNFEGIDGIPFVKSKIKVGDKVNIIGKVVNNSEYPVLIKAKVIKNISRRQPKIPVLKKLLLEKVEGSSGIKERVKKKIKEEVEKKNIKRIRRKVKAQDLRKQIQELLKKVQQIQLKIR